MHALVCRRFADPPQLAIEEVPEPALRPQTIAIDVHAAGVNFLDSLIVRGTYQVKPPLPFSPGAEVAGIVSAVGAGVTEFAIGDRAIGMLTYGGFADRAVVDAASALAIPRGMDFPTAAGFGLTYGTSYHALVDRARIAPGERLLVLGAGGGVGLAAVEIGAALGATVIAAAGSHEKLEAAKSRGATELIEYGAPTFKERLKEIAGTRGFDVIYDAVGGDYFDAAFRHIAWNGRALVVGFAAGRIPEIPLNRLLLRSSSVMGVYFGVFAMREPAHNRANFRALAELHASGALRPIVTARYPLERAAEAIDDLAARKIVGKAIVTLRP